MEVRRIAVGEGDGETLLERVRPRLAVADDERPVRAEQLVAVEVEVVPVAVVVDIRVAEQADVGIGARAGAGEADALGRVHDGAAGR